jgi:hypothetical protein
MNESTCEQMLGEKQVAARLNVSVATLRRWRMLRQGPDYIRYAGSGGSVRYHPAAIERFIQAGSVNCKAERFGR